MTDQVLGYSVLNQNREDVYVTRNLAKRVGECKSYIEITKYAEGKAKRVKWDIVDVKETEHGTCFMHIQRKVGNVVKMALRMFHIDDELTIMSNAVYKY